MGADVQQGFVGRNNVALGTRMPVWYVQSPREVGVLYVNEKALVSLVPGDNDNHGRSLNLLRVQRVFKKLQIVCIPTLHMKKKRAVNSNGMWKRIE